MEPITATGKGLEIPKVSEVLPVTASLQGNKKGETEAPGKHNTAAMSEEAIKEMIEDIQNQLNNMRVDLTFSTYGAEKNICIIVKESKSGKIIREIPPKELQQLAAKLDELNSILFSKSV